MYLSGHLHRGISLRNILMADELVKGRRFKIPREFHDHLSSLQDQKAVEAIKDLCGKIEEAVAKLGISDQCTAFITDSNHVTPWRDGWVEESFGTKSVSRSQVARKATLDTIHRMHPSSCLGRSWSSSWQQRRMTTTAGFLMYYGYATIRAFVLCMM